MKRNKQQQHNKQVIVSISRMLTSPYKRPSYKSVCLRLNKNNITSSVGNYWTERSIYRMLQRCGYSGLWGLQKSYINN
jgi:hypothetical protein